MEKNQPWDQIARSEVTSTSTKYREPLVIERLTIRINVVHTINAVLQMDVELVFLHWCSLYLLSGILQFSISCQTVYNFLSLVRQSTSFYLLSDSLQFSISCQAVYKFLSLVKQSTSNLWYVAKHWHSVREQPKIKNTHIKTCIKQMKCSTIRYFSYFYLLQYISNILF